MKKTSVLDEAKDSSSVLTHTVQLQHLAARIGFDWPSIGSVFAKLEEEVAELRVEVAANAKQERLVDELGDILFVIANLARHLRIDPKVALKHANEKFSRRFREMEQQLNQDYPQQTSYSLALMDKIWEQVKQAEG
jgi:nucleoside triphosphate diphosphatase